MENSLILYTYQRCQSTRIILFIKQFTTLKIDLVYLDNMNEVNIKKILNKSPTRTLPVIRNGEFYISGAIAIINYLAALDSNMNDILIGKDNITSSEISMWLNHISYNLWSFHSHIIGAITGTSESNDEIFKTAIEDMINILSNINDYLRYKTFLIGNQITLADLVLCSTLHPYFSLVLNENIRDKIPNLTRLYLFVSNLKQFSSVFGKARFCLVSQKPGVGVAIPVKEASKETKNEKKKEVTKVNQVKKEEKKEEKNTEPVVEEKTKKVNPLDLLAPSKFELDNFKKEFLNTTAKKEVLDKFWHNYDPEGYSLWFIHYNKSGDQGRLKFKTCNLKSNFLQRLEKFRRYSFSVHGVYGSEPNLEVEGIWMWRGTDIPEEIRGDDSFEFLSIKKLDSKNEEDRRLVEEFWLKIDEDLIVNGRPVVDAEYFK